MAPARVWPLQGTWHLCAHHGDHRASSVHQGRAGSPHLERGFCTCTCNSHDGVASWGHIMVTSCDMVWCSIKGEWRGGCLRAVVAPLRRRVCCVGDLGLRLGDIGGLTARQGHYGMALGLAHCVGLLCPMPLCIPHQAFGHHPSR